MENKELRIEKALEEMFPEDLLMLHNEYCEANNCVDDYVYFMDDFDEIMGGMKPWEIARATFYGNRFNPCDDYFYFNAYGNLESLQYADDANGEVIFTGDIAEYITRTGDDLGNDEIAEILEEE